MMLLARLRMLFANDPRVRVDAASLIAVNRVDLFWLEISSFCHSSSSSASCSSLLFLIQNQYTKNTTKATNATPPTTPPAIAPTLGPLDGGAGVGFGMQVMCAQVLHDCGTREQILPLAQVGQVGVYGGHFTQRAKMLRSVCSTSVA